MESLAQLASWSLLAFASLLFLAQLASREFGYWLGRRHYEQRGTADAEGTALVVGGLIGLLAFVLALTLSFGSTRFDERRRGTLAEANAIGTALLRAGAVGHPKAAEISKLLTDYTHIRRDYISAPRNVPLLQDLNQKSSKLQTEIWDRMTLIAAERTDPVVVALMTALNDVFDMGTSTRFAHDIRIPESLLWLLIGMAVISMGALGYQLGLKEQRSHIIATVLTAVWTAVIIVILDLSAPRFGSIRTNVEVYDWLLQDMNGGKSNEL